VPRTTKPKTEPTPNIEALPACSRKGQGMGTGVPPRRRCAGAWPRPPQCSDCARHALRPSDARQHAADKQTHAHSAPLRAGRRARKVCWRSPVGLVEEPRHGVVDVRQRPWLPQPHGACQRELATFLMQLNGADKSRMRVTALPPSRARCGLRPVCARCFHAPELVWGRPPPCTALPTRQPHVPGPCTVDPAACQLLRRRESGRPGPMNDEPHAEQLHARRTQPVGDTSITAQTFPALDAVFYIAKHYIFHVHPFHQPKINISIPRRTRWSP
jgi:hypothetical protein